MAISGAILGNQILSKFAMFGFTGAQASTIAMALGNGIINNILVANIFNGITFGTGPGPGNSTGKVVGLVGPVVAQNIALQMAIKGWSGSQMSNFSNAIGMAFSEHVTAFGIITAMGAPVAIGSGTGPILGIVGPVLGQSIFSTMLSMNLKGAQALNLAMSVGSGIALSMSLAIGQTVIVGIPASPPPAGPYPMAGVESGKLT